MESKSRLIGLKEVEHRVNQKKTTIYRGMKDGTFPKRYPNGWLESDIDKYIDDIVMAHNPAR